MSKQLALAISFSVLATLGLALFGVDPVGQYTSAAGAPAVINVEASPLPALSQLLPSLQ